MKKKLFLYLVPLTLCLLVACKSTKQAVLTQDVTFKTLSAPTRLTLQPGNGKEISVDAQLKIIHNEAIQLSLRMPILGSEVARVVITPDNLLIINRMNKQYVQEPMSVIKNQLPLPLDYAGMEAVLTGKNTHSNIPCEYSNWKNDFPMRIQVAKTVEDSRYGMIWDFKSVNFDTEISIDSSIPNNYKQITLQQAMKLIQNLL